MDFNSLNFATLLENAEGGCDFFYQGPQFAVTKVVSAVVAQGECCNYQRRSLEQTHLTSILSLDRL